MDGSTIVKVAYKARDKKKRSAVIYVYMNGAYFDWEPRNFLQRDQKLSEMNESSTEYPGTRYANNMVSPFRGQTCVYVHAVCNQMPLYSTYHNTCTDKVSLLSVLLNVHAACNPRSLQSTCYNICNDKVSVLCD